MIGRAFGVERGGPAAEESQSLGGARSGFCRLRVQAAFVVLQFERLDVGGELAHDGVVEARGAAAARDDVVVGPPDPELGTGDGELADQRAEGCVSRVAMPARVKVARVMRMPGDSTPERRLLAKDPTDHHPQTNEQEVPATLAA